MSSLYIVLCIDCETHCFHVYQGVGVGIRVRERECVGQYFGESIVSKLTVNAVSYKERYSSSLLDSDSASASASLAPSGDGTQRKRSRWGFRDAKIA